MPDLVDMVMRGLGPEMVPQLARLAGLSPGQTPDALNSVVPVLVHGFGTLGSTSAGAAQLSQLANSQQGVPSFRDQLRSEDASTSLTGSGSKLLPAVFGSDLGRTTDCVATTSGISHNSASALMHLVAPLVMETIGGEARRLGFDETRLSSFLGDQRSSTIQAMPTGLGNCLGIERPAVAATGVREAAVAAPVAAETVRPAADGRPRAVYVEPARQATPWWLWALPLVALVGLGAWLLSMNRPAAPEVAAPAVPTVAAPAVPTVAPAVPTVAPAVPTVAPAAPTVAPAAVSTVAAPAAPTAVPTLVNTSGAAAGAPAAAAATALTGTTWGLERFQRTNQPAFTPNPGDYSLKFGTPSDAGRGNADIKAECDSGQGTYNMQGSSMAIDTSAVPQTACGAGSLSTDFLSGLRDVSTYNITNGRLTLNLNDNAGTMQFAPQP